MEITQVLWGLLKQPIYLFLSTHLHLLKGHIPTSCTMPAWLTKLTLGVTFRHPHLLFVEKGVKMQAVVVNTLAVSAT